MQEMLYFVTTKLGEKRSLTPEKFLVCQDVPIARIGFQVYHPSELGPELAQEIGVTQDGLVHLWRKPEQVFRPETIASFEGKPMVNDHPDGNIVPERIITPIFWKEFAVGTVMNVRADEENGFLLADLMVMDPDVIEDIVSNRKLEVSCGYKAGLEKIAEGEASQINIIGNHVALVDNARCGSSCSIGDGQSKGDDMKTKKKSGFFDSESWKKLRKLFSDNKEAEKLLDAAEEEGKEMHDEEPEGGGIHIHAGGEGRSKYTDEALDKKFADSDAMHEEHKKTLAAHDASIKSMLDAAGSDGDKEIEGELKEEAPPGTSDEAFKGHDSAFLEAPFADAVSMAETILPGIMVPKFDRTKTPKQTFTDICNMRKKTLLLATHDPRLSGVIEGLRGSFLDAETVTKMPCKEVRTLFRQIGEVKRQANNRNAFSDNRPADRTTTASDGTVKPVKSMADLNERNKNFYGKNVVQ